MIVTLEETKKWLRVDTNEEDTLIQSFIGTAEDIVTGILRYSLSEEAIVGETIKQAVMYTVSQFYELRESLNMNVLLDTLKGMLFAYREAAW